VCDFASFGNERYLYSPIAKREIQLLNTVVKNGEGMSLQDMGVKQDQHLVRVYGTYLSHDGENIVIQGTKSGLAIEASQRNDEEETMTTKDCSKGSKRNHKRSSEDKFYRELVVTKAQLEVLRESLQRDLEDQIYGWTLQKKRVKWSLLQDRLGHKSNAQLREELRKVELQHKTCVRKEGYLGEPE